MGTGAAQVAVAAGHEGALTEVGRLMTELLANVPEGGVISYDDANRLYELSWALTFSSARKRPTDLVHQVMRRRERRPAPPFGLVEVRPERFCRVLAKLEGRPSLQPYTFCDPEWRISP